MKSGFIDLFTLLKNNQLYKIAKLLTADLEKKLTLSTNALVTNIHQRLQ
jgi:hypothetical protein